MTTEREMFRDSLEPTDAEWVDYRKLRVLGRRNECPSLTALHAYAMQRSGNAEEARSIEQHSRDCGYCRACITGFRQAAGGKEPGSTPRPGSLLAEVCKPVPTAKMAPPPKSPRGAQHANLYGGAGNGHRNEGNGRHGGPGKHRRSLRCDPMKPPQPSWNLTPPYILIEIGHSRDLAAVRPVSQGAAGAERPDPLYRADSTDQDVPPPHGADHPRVAAQPDRRSHPEPGRRSPADRGRKRGGRARFLANGAGSRSGLRPEVRLAATGSGPILQRNPTRTASGTHPAGRNRAELGSFGCQRCGGQRNALMSEPVRTAFSSVGVA